MRKYLGLAVAAAGGRICRPCRGGRETQDRLFAWGRRPILPGHAARRGKGGQGSRRRGRHPDPADLGRRGPDAASGFHDRARRPQLHHHRRDRQGSDDRPSQGRRGRWHQSHHRRQLHWRRRLRERPGQIPDHLHRLQQYRGRPHRGARAGQGDRRQGNRLHQLDQSQREFGRGPRKGFQGGDGQGLSEHQGAGPRL